MTWTKLSDEFTDRPDLLEVSRSARLLHIEALVYCNRHLRNGRFPSGALVRVTDAEDPAADAAELVAAGLWETVEGGWQIDWTDQEAAEDVRARQEYRASTQKRYRERKAKHDRGDHSMCDPRFCKKSVTGNATDNKNAHETPSRPVPSRPLGRDRDRGAGPAGAGAPPVRAAATSEPCPHGIKGGLQWRADSYVCSRCATLAPESLDFAAEWMRHFDRLGVTLVEVDDKVELLLNGDGEDWHPDYDQAYEIAHAVYRRLLPVDADGAATEPEFLKLIHLKTLSALRPTLIDDAVEQLRAGREVTGSSAEDDPRTESAQLHIDGPAIDSTACGRCHQPNPDHLTRLYCPSCWDTIARPKERTA